MPDLGGARLVSECEKVPCVSFMRPQPQWEGREALESQTLLHLGLVSGSALLKHSFAGTAPPGNLCWALGFARWRAQAAQAGVAM